MNHERHAHNGGRIRGMTIIELMVTLTVLGILLAIGVPSFATLLATNRMAGNTNEFVTILHLARSEAVRRGQPVSMRSVGGSASFESGWKAFTDADGDGAAPSTVTDADGTVIRESGALSGKTTVTRVTQSGTGPNFTYATSTADDRMYVVFNARGGNDAMTSAFFKICDAGSSSVKGRVVQVSPIGKISLVTSNATCP